MSKSYILQFEESEDLRKQYKDWERFLVFVASYKRPDGFWNAIKSWHKLTERDKRRIFDTVDDFVKSHPKEQFRPMMATYLNQRRFDDEVRRHEPADAFTKIYEELKNKDDERRAEENQQ